MGAVFTLSTSDKIKRTAAASAFGLLVTVLLQLSAAFFASRFLQNEAALTYISAAAVLLGCAAASYAAGGKIYGAATFAVIMLIMFLVGAVVFKSGINAKSAVPALAAGAAGTLLGMIFAKSKK